MLDDSWSHTVTVALTIEERVHIISTDSTPSIENVTFLSILVVVVVYALVIIVPSIVAIVRMINAIFDGTCVMGTFLIVAFVVGLAIGDIVASMLTSSGIESSLGLWTLILFRMLIFWMSVNQLLYPNEKEKEEGIGDMNGLCQVV